ncbi:MAG: hypothetical protein CMP23_17565 [Rickettsiales bacterium]|nr:hypothetical protein [Rickettsiales bacterium]
MDSVNRALLCCGLPLLSLLLACQGPVTSSPSLIAQAAEQEQQLLQGGGPPPQRSAGSDGMALGYQKRTGLHIDIPYLCDRRLESIREEDKADQLGGLLTRKELPENEEELTFEKATVWLYDGRVYRIRKKLGHPMDVPTALGTSGFPLDLGPPIESTSELRWNFTWNTRRIRLERSGSDERLYLSIDVHAFMPKELF